MPKLPPKPSGGGDIKGRNLNFGPLLPETGELWPTFWDLWKELGRATSPPNFVSLSLKTKILIRINMGPPSAHTRKRKRVRKDYIGIEWYRLNIPPHSAWSESRGVMPSANNFASGVISERRWMFCLLRSCSMVLPNVALAWSMWAKVQKQKSYKRPNFENNSNFLEIMN